MSDKRNRHGVAPEAWAKFDAALKRAVADAGAGRPTGFPAIVVLSYAGSPAGKDTSDPPSGRADREERRRRAARREAAFGKETEPLVQEVERAGARDVAIHWINRTVSLRAPRGALEAAGKREEVQEIMLAPMRRAIPQPPDLEP